MASQNVQYHPKDTVKTAMGSAAIVGGAGAMVSAVQNTLTRRNVSAMGVFTKFGTTTALFTAIGGAFEFTRCASANLRERDDSYNAALGGFMGGAVMGLYRGTTPAILGFGALTAIVMGAFEFTGDKLSGPGKDEELDEFARKEQLRKNRRRPIEETISELGEGRGIYGPGYEERRRQRIKEKYGIEIPAQS